MYALGTDPRILPCFQKLLSCVFSKFKCVNIQPTQFFKLEDHLSGSTAQLSSESLLTMCLCFSIRCCHTQVIIWEIPEPHMEENLTDYMVKLQGHSRKCVMVEWHPTASSILASAGFDGKVNSAAVITCF